MKGIKIVDLRSAFVEGECNCVGCMIIRAVTEVEKRENILEHTTETSKRPVIPDEAFSEYKKREEPFKEPLQVSPSPKEIFKNEKGCDMDTISEKAFDDVKAVDQEDILRDKKELNDAASTKSIANAIPKSNGFLQEAFANLDSLKLNGAAATNYLYSGLAEQRCVSLIFNLAEAKQSGNGGGSAVHLINSVGENKHYLKQNTASTIELHSKDFNHGFEPGLYEVTFRKIDS